MPASEPNIDNLAEQFPSPPNLSPEGGPAARIRFLLRRLADLQVASVLRHLIPWIEKLSGSVLEVGCGAQPYRTFIPSGCKYQGLDWEGANEHFQYQAPDTAYYNGREFPFPDNTFDNLFHTEVLEHIFHKELFLSECNRVLKPGGRIFFSVPFQARYHYKPHDYWRFTPAALQRMLTDAGFTGIVVSPRGNDITVAIYKNVSLAYRLLQGGIAAKLAGLLLLPFTLPGLLPGHFTIKYPATGSTDDCLGFVVTATAGD